MKQYIINQNTLALLPVKEGTMVIEKYITFCIENSIYNILDESTKYYGSSYIGRCKSAAYLLGICQKCPIIISENKEIIFFPSLSIKNEKCAWFNVNGIEKYFSEEKNYLNITLTNGINAKIKCSGYVFSNQYLKAVRLNTILKRNNK